MRTPGINRVAPRLRGWFLAACLAPAVFVAAGASSAGAKFTVHRDLEYVPGGHVRQKLDLYLPSGHAKALPVLIWIHGGGWEGGSKSDCLPVRSGFVARGYAVASINYRLSQDAIFPAQIEDCKAAVRWLRAHAKDYDLDPNRFAVWGESAGGHLAALLGTSGGVEAFEVGEFLDQSSRVQAVVDFYGPSVFARLALPPGFENSRTPDSPESKLLGGLLSQRKELADEASPVTYVSRDDPPFLILHGDHDHTVPLSQSEALHFALQRAQASSDLRVLAGADHGGREFTSKLYLNLIADFLTRSLGR